ncbi:site-specific integrase [Chloroflexi bacterium TSY]|nr:site-specific integrase [Chloroflexi bacterium TSY]MBV7332649.1 site-specific integrase [Chloroflexi bacterium TSY]
MLGYVWAKCKLCSFEMPNPIVTVGCLLPNALLLPSMPICNIAPMTWLLIPRFLLRDGLPLRANYVRNHLHAFAAQANLEGVTPHRLRHTFATRLLNSGLMPITTLQKLMGHTHIDTTMLYAQLYDETIQQHYLAAMASHSVYAIPEPDPAIWGPTLENAFESTFQQQPL